MNQTFTVTLSSVFGAWVSTPSPPVTITGKNVAVTAWTC